MVAGMGSMNVTGVWYIDTGGSSIAWASAVVARRATTAIYRLSRSSGTSTLSVALWATNGQPVTDDAQADAIAETTPGPPPTAPVDLPDLPGLLRLADQVGTPYSSSYRMPVDLGGATITAQQLLVEYQSHVSTMNSTETPLPAGGVFTGTWEDVRDYAAIAVAILTDAPSASNGAVIEFSGDGTNVIRSVPTSIPANVGSHFSLGPQARYFRIRYTNGATAQTLLRSQVILRFAAPGEVLQPFGATVTDGNLATVVQAGMKGRLYSGTTAGTYVPVQVNTSGHISVRVEDAPLAYPLPTAQVTALTPQTNALTDSQLRLAPLPVSGAVSVSNLPATQPVSIAATVEVAGVFFPTTQPVSGTVTVANPPAAGLTDSQLRATPVPVAGTVTADTGLAQPLTDTQLRAVPLPVSGTVTANTGLTQPLTDTQLRASPLPVGGTVALDAPSLAALETIQVANLPAAYPLPTAQVTALTPQTNALTRAQLDAAPVVTADGRSLTERMLARAPAATYALWLDTADTSFIYIAEAPQAATGAASTFRGIRVQKDLLGNPLGKVQQAVDFAWNSRGAAAWT
jgi:hypothetical protein